MDDATLLEVLHATATAVRRRPRRPGRLGPGRHPWRTSTGHDLVADAAGLGRARRGRARGAVRGVRDPRTWTGPWWWCIDPVDGSTNASEGIPWYATSLCAVDADGPRAAVVVNQASGVRFEAVRGGGARKDGVADPAVGVRAAGARPSSAFSGYPPRYLGWSQYRCLGAAALDLCAVAEGVLDGYAVVGGSTARELGLPRAACWSAPRPEPCVGEAQGRDLVTLDPTTERRTPFAAATPASARRSSWRRRRSSVCACRAFSSVG